MNFRKGGFSLVEVFLATALLGIILVTLFSAYAAGIRIWRSAKDFSLSREGGFYIALEKMTEEVSGYIRDFGEIEFKGSTGELSFPGVSGSDIKEITYFFDKNQKGLFRKTVKFSESLKEKMKEDKSLLFEAKEVKFRYLFHEEDEADPYWENDFSGEEDGIPAAVEININRNDEDTTEFIFIPQ